MAIRQTKANTLGQTELTEKQVEQKNSSSDRSLPKKLEKKPGFLASTIEEMKKVEWPSFKYTVNWSVIIIIFTTFFALSIGLIDHVFDSSLKYVQCTANITTAASNDKDENNNRFKDCNTDLVKNISFRG
ncbi:MAG: preprotein translocase subunit SecE [candidate division SR1 bacterium]|nr:preprotein translocase subunit SecE [candidate division SR1 bacterium]